MANLVDKLSLQNLVSHRTHRASNAFSKCFLLDCPDLDLNQFLLPMVQPTLAGHRFRPDLETSCGP
jgi:hypothetical protein